MAFRHTRDFDDQVAWLVTHTSKPAVVELMRTSWCTVGAIAARVVAGGRAAHDPFYGLVRIGIDEISYRRGHKYLMVVVDHDTGRLVWIAEGHDRRTLQVFFDLLGPQRASKIELVSADAAEWIGDCAITNFSNADLCLDPMLPLLSSDKFGSFRPGRNLVDVSGEVAPQASDCLASFPRRSDGRRSHE